MGMQRELPFGARISDSFVKKLKWETAKAKWEGLLGVWACLWVEERQGYQTAAGEKAQARRLDFEKGLEIPPVNRLVPPTPPFALERVWVLSILSGNPPPTYTFEIDGLKLLIRPRDQHELKGGTISVVNDEIVVKYETI
jgi:hypothetical protein